MAIVATDDEQLGTAIRRLHYRHHRALDARLRELGASPAQWDALRAIALRPGSSGHALAEMTFQSDQSFGALAGRMVERGLIERIPGPGRAIRHRLTPEGEQLLRRGRPITAEVLAESLAPLSATERDTLAQLLGKLLADRPQD